MKTLYIALASITLSLAAKASESALITTYQPLWGLGAGRVFVVPVACHDFHPYHGSAIRLISAKNVPPTNQPNKAKEDINLASVCGLKFVTSDLGLIDGPLKISMDCTKFVVPKTHGGAEYQEDIVAACLECLRLCLPSKLLKTPVTLKAGDADVGWANIIIRKFNNHDRSKKFYGEELQDAPNSP